MRKYYTSDKLFLIFLIEVFLYTITQVTNPHNAANLHWLLSLMSHAVGLGG